MERRKLQQVHGRQDKAEPRGQFGAGKARTRISSSVDRQDGMDRTGNSSDGTAEMSHPEQEREQRLGASPSSYSTE